VDPIRLFLVNFLQLYTYVLMARILLSWFPAIDWYKQPWKGLDDVTEPVMSPFRKLIPPIGGLDLSPIFLFLAINILTGLLSGGPFFSASF
jgi:YggT family protein